MNKVNFSELKQKRVRVSFDNGIEIYNPNKIEKEEIINIMMNSVDTETKEIKISGNDIMIKLLPICSNIYIDLEDEELLNDIIENPSYELEKAVDEIEKIVTELSDITAKNIKKFSELTPEQISQLLNIEDKMTEEETAELKRLEEKAKKAKLK